MAQKLKDETRNAILTAAKEEFLEKGYENASMRSIAAKADITVGNIYRYFENKEDLNRCIISDTSEEIRNLLDSLKVNRLPREPRVFDIKTDTVQLEEMFDRLSYRLVDMYMHKEAEFNILLNDPSLSGMVSAWFEKTFFDLISQTYNVADRNNERQVLAHAYAISVFEGLKEIFRKCDREDSSLIIIVRSYLHGFIRMVNDEYTFRKYF